MRLNHKKSKVMHHRRVFKDGEDAGYETGGVRFEQPKAPDGEGLILFKLSDIMLIEI